MKITHGVSYASVLHAVVDVLGCVRSSAQYPGSDAYSCTVYTAGLEVHNCVTLSDDGPYANDAVKRTFAESSMILDSDSDGDDENVAQGANFLAFISHNLHTSP